MVSRSNRVYSSMGLTRLSRSRTPAPPRSTVTLYRGTGPISAIAASGRRQSVRPRDPTTVLLVAATTNPNAILALYTLLLS